MPQANINEFMGWFWTALGVIGGGLASIGIYLWKLASKFAGYDKDIEQLKEDHDEDMKKIEKELTEIRHSQESKEKLMHEIIEKLSETKDYIAEENRKSNDAIRDYFDKKYTILDARIYELKK